MTDEELQEPGEERPVIVNYSDNKGRFLLIDITVFISILKSFYESADKRIKKAQIERIVNSGEWIEHYYDKTSGRKVLAETELIEHEHELLTAIKLAQVNYDVVFAPKGLFSRESKKYDVFLIREYVLLKADLKAITSKNPDTIADRIKGGCDQASRVVLDIMSDIEIKKLVEGLRSGSYKNNLLKEIFLFYRNRFYVLPKNLIVSKKIFNLIQ